MHNLKIFVTVCCLGIVPCGLFASEETANPSTKPQATQVVAQDETDQGDDEASDSPFATKESALTTDSEATPEKGEAEGPSPLGNASLTAQETTVGSAGGAVQSIPIKVLPARHGGQPSIALVYSSDMRQSGVAGYAVSLAAGGAITRSGYRGAVVPPESYGPGFFGSFDWSQEQYAIGVGGTQELFLADKGSGALLFRPRYESHWTVTADQQSEFNNWIGHAPNGWKYYFSSEPDDTLQIKRNTQFLTMAESPDGKTNIFYKYMQGSSYTVGDDDVGARTILLKEIRYGCMLIESDTCYRVLFTYLPRSDVDISAQPGQLVAYNDLLDTIQVITPTGKTAWTYRLEYTMDAFNKRRLLQKVHHEFAGKAPMPPFQFQFSEAKLPTDSSEPVTFSNEVESAEQSTGSAKWFGVGASLADLNHDGLPDIVERGPHARDWLNLGAGQFSEAPSTFGPAGDFWLTTYIATYKGKSSNLGTYKDWHIQNNFQSGALQGDLDGDGIPELIKQGSPKNSGNSIPEGMLPDGIWDIHGNPLNGPTGLPKALFVGGKTNGIEIIDLNGDGFSDVLYAGVDEPFQTWLYHPASKTFVEAPSMQSPIPLIYKSPYVWKQDDHYWLGAQFVDLNGDGLVDIYNMNNRFPAWNGIWINAGNSWIEASGSWGVEWMQGTYTKVITQKTCVESHLATAPGGNAYYPCDKWETEFEEVPMAYNSEAGHLVEHNGQMFPASAYFTTFSQTNASVPSQSKWQEETHDAGWRFVDINADGIIDILSGDGKAEGSVYKGGRVLLGTAHRIFTHTKTETWLPLVSVDEVVNEVCPTDAWNDYYKMCIHPKYVRHTNADGCQYTDVNGDLAVDTVCASQDLGQPEKIYVTSHLNPLPHPGNLLTRVTAPMGSQTYLSYTTHVEPGVASGGAKLVVAKVEYRDADGWAYQEREYAFAEPQFKYQPLSGLGLDNPPLLAEFDFARGPEFLGFNKVQVIDKGAHPGLGGFVHERRTTTTYDNGYLLLGRVKSFTTQVRSDINTNPSAQWELIAQTTNDYYPPSQFGSNTMPFQILPKSIVTTHSEGSPIETKTEYLTYDPKGFPTSIKQHGRTDAKVGISDDVTETRTYTELTDKHIFGLVATKTVQWNGLETSTTGFYDDLGRVTRTEITSPHVPHTLWTVNEYDGVGNVTAVLRQGAAASDYPLKTTTMYDTDYQQFLVSSSDPLGHRTTATYYGVNAEETFEHPATFGQVARQYGIHDDTHDPVMYQLMTYDAFARPAQRYTMAQLVEDDAQFYPVLNRQWSFFPDFDAGHYMIRMTDDLAFPKDAPTDISETTLSSIGQILKLRRQGKNGWRQMLTDYGPFGTVWRSSEPHPEGTSPIWTTTTVDAMGRPTLVEGPGSVTATAYGNFWTEITVATGATTRVELDAKDRIIERLHLGGGMTKTAYTMDGKIVTTGPYGGVTEHHLNDFGWVTYRKDPDRGARTFAYNGQGQKMAQTDALGVTMHYHYDFVGRLTHLDAGDGTDMAKYYYDGMTPEKTSTSATALGKQSAMVDAAGRSIALFNAFGQVAETTRTIDGKTYHAAYRYDALGRPVELRHLKTADTAITSDGAGGGKMPPRGVDTSIRLAREIQRLPMLRRIHAYSQRHAMQTQRKYKPVTTEQTALYTLQYRYDIDGIDNVRYQLGDQPWQTVVASVDFDGFANLQSVMYGNNTQETHNYDATTRLLTQRKVLTGGGGDTPLLDFSYTYDHPLHFITDITDGAHPNHTQTFTYGMNNALTSAESPLYGHLDYDTDAIGRLLQHGPLELNYDDAEHPNAVSSAVDTTSKTAIAYDYDANGNVTASKGRTFAYDQRRNLTQIQTPFGSASFTLDGEGRRLKKSVTILEQDHASRKSHTPHAEILYAQRGSGEKARGTPRALQQTVEESPAIPLGVVPGATKSFNPNKTPSLLDSTAEVPSPLERLIPKLPRWRPKHYTVITPFDGLEITESSEGTVVRYHIMVMQQRIATVTTIAGSETTTTWYYADHLGSRTVMADLHGDVVGEPTFYAPYGVPLNTEGKPQWDGWQDTTNMYAGVELADVANLYYTGPRVYDPIVGRFLNPDPVPGDTTDTPNINPYSYAGNNPIMATDATGLFIQVLVAIVAMAVVAIVGYVASGGDSFFISFGGSFGGPTDNPSTSGSIDVVTGDYGGGGGGSSHDHDAIHGRRRQADWDTGFMAHMRDASFKRSSSNLIGAYYEILADYGIKSSEAPLIIVMDPDEKLTVDDREYLGMYVSAAQIRSEGMNSVMRSDLHPTDSMQRNHVVGLYMERGVIIIADRRLDTLFHEVGHYFSEQGIIGGTGRRYGGRFYEEQRADVFMRREMDRRGFRKTPLEYQSYSTGRDIQEHCGNGSIVHCNWANQEVFRNKNMPWGPPGS